MDSFSNTFLVADRTKEQCFPARIVGVDNSKTVPEKLADVQIGRKGKPLFCDLEVLNPVKPESLDAVILKVFGKDVPPSAEFLKRIWMNLPERWILFPKLIIGEFGH